MRNTIHKTDGLGVRLYKLMSSYDPPIKNADALSELLHESGILKYTTENREGRPMSKSDCLRNRARTISSHLNDPTFTKISSEWLKIYCDFFGCSADYLLGYIDLPTHDETNIYNHTGLSEDAIDKLYCLYNTVGDKFDVYDAISCLDIINGLLKSEDFMYLINLINNADLSAISIKRYNKDLERISHDKNAKTDGIHNTMSEIIEDIDCCCSSLAYSKYELISVFQKLTETRYKNTGSFPRPLKNDFTLSERTDTNNLPLIGKV